MKYCETRPQPPLSRFIECFWTLEGDPGCEPARPERILPDGCVELILNFGASFDLRHPDGPKERQPLHFLVGQMTRPVLISPTGCVQLMGVRFHPGGTLPFFRSPMREVTNRVVDLGDLDTHFGHELLMRASEAPSLPQRIAAVERVLTRIACNVQRVSWLEGVAAEMVRRGGQMSVDWLARKAGISRRQLERKFLSEVGLGPKLLCRILRFQEVFRAVEQNDAGWAGVAADCGYYDQSHLIHDFREFAGEPPAALVPQLHHLTEAFTRKNRLSHFSNTTT